MKIKRFNEQLENISENSDDEQPDIRVKDIINFLNKFDPETLVYLDRDGWQMYKTDISKDDVIRRLIDDGPITHRDENYLIINN